MASIDYRDLEAHEAALLATIDRSEFIDGTYRATNGKLELDATSMQVPTWAGAEFADYVSRLQVLMNSGGRVFAAWDERALAGIGSLDTSGVGGDRAVMKLDMLYVNAEHRGRGIGRALTELVAQRARSLGATALYISATPTRRTVEAYLRMGARVLEVPDPKSLALEPEDIHLSLSLA